MSKSWIVMSRKRPPETRTYSSGGGNGSRLEIRTRWISPTADGTDVRQVERERLLAEDGLARLGRGDGEIRVRVGARADRHGVDLGVREHLVHPVVDRHAVLPRQRPRLRGAHVVHAIEDGAPDAAVKEPRVDAPDPARAHHADPHRPSRRPPRRRDRRLAHGPHHASRSDTTSSHRPDSHDRSSAACTPTAARASSKPGLCGRPSATERQNSKSSIATRSSNPMPFALPGTKRPWYGNRSPP